MVGVVKKNIKILKKPMAQSEVAEEAVAVIDEVPPIAVNEPVEVAPVVDNDMPWDVDALEDKPAPEEEPKVNKVQVKKKGAQQVKSGQAVAEVSTTKTSGKEVVEETHEQEVLGEEQFSGPMAEVEVSMGLTKNLGNYESLKFNVSIRIPCAVNAQEIEDTYANAREWIDGKINELSEEVDAQLAG